VEGAQPLSPPPTTKIGEVFVTFMSVKQNPPKDISRSPGINPFHPFLIPNALDPTEMEFYHGFVIFQQRKSLTISVPRILMGIEGTRRSSYMPQSYLGTCLIV
jgi:hypothetical protein